MTRRALLAVFASLPACGGEFLAVDARDAAVRDVPSLCRDAGTSAVPTTLTDAGACTARSTGRWCEGDVVRTCGTRAGVAPPERSPCGAGERCVMRGPRGACEPAGACREGAARCASATRLARCAGGAWTEETCAARCVGDGLGAACVDLSATRALTGSVRYMRRAIASDLLSWQAPAQRPARGFAVQYRRGDAVLARGVTDEQGRYALDAPAAAAPGDALAVLAATGEEGRITLMVGDPGLPDGSYRTFETAARGGPWTWRFPVSDGGTSLDIPLETSPGASVFDDLRAGVASVRARMGTPARYALAAWVKRGVQWDCGACFSELVPITLGAQRFDGQLWITGDTSEPWWSDAVTLHEMGHWAMAAWGVIPHEGGAHFLGVPTLPGTAWSEGWASWVSSELRADPRHYAVAGGTFFWWDIARRELFNGSPWSRPSPIGTLLQLMDENEVSAVLWSLQGDASAARIYRAMATPRMTVAPFARCNTQTFYVSGGNGSVCTSGEHAPHLADLLDALRCDGVPASVVRAAAGTYPYPADAPRCEVGCLASACVPQRSCGASAPITLRWREIDAVDGRVRLAAVLAQPGDLGAAVTVRVELPPGVARVDGPLAWTVPAHADHTEVITLAGAGPVTVRAVAEGRSAWAGARARAAWSGTLGAAEETPRTHAGRNIPSGS